MPPASSAPQAPLPARCVLPTCHTVPCAAPCANPPLANLCASTPATCCLLHSLAAARYTRRLLHPAPTSRCTLHPPAAAPTAALAAPCARTAPTRRLLNRPLTLLPPPLTLLPPPLAARCTRTYCACCTRCTLRTPALRYPILGLQLGPLPRTGCYCPSLHAPCDPAAASTLSGIPPSISPAPATHLHPRHASLGRLATSSRCRRCTPGPRSPVAPLPRGFSSLDGAALAVPSLPLPYTPPPPSYSSTLLSLDIPHLISHFFLPRRCT
ncbi:hypothetical protein B0H12DRAFT_1244881 [Mycena haematopus]|nr:hypothetical protein B0H12DRAFT_1244881 [Mycena haematopus]